MALTDKQKNDIHRRANAGESGSALAKEFKISASAVSKIKNHYAPTTDAASIKSVKNTPSTKKDVIEVEVKKAEPIVTSNSNLIECVVSSTKIANKTVFLKEGSTLGDLITAVDEKGALEGVFKNVKRGEKDRVKKLSDVIPAQAGEKYSVYLLPLKSDSGI